MAAEHKRLILRKPEHNDSGDYIIRWLVIASTKENAVISIIFYFHLRTTLHSAHWTYKCNDDKLRFNWGYFLAVASHCCSYLDLCRASSSGSCTAWVEINNIHVVRTNKNLLAEQEEKSIERVKRKGVLCTDCIQCQWCGPASWSSWTAGWQNDGPSQTSPGSLLTGSPSGKPGTRSLSRGPSWAEIHCRAERGRM